MHFMLWVFQSTEETFSVSKHLILSCTQTTLQNHYSDILAECYCDVWSSGTCISHDAQLIKVKMCTLGVY
jgi:hypothetical protein